MARLDRITTGTGDRGATSLGDGSRVEKNSLRVCAYGSVDELNSLFGVVLLEDLPPGVPGELRRIQHELFDLGADLATPAGPREALRIDDAQVARLEEAVAAASEGLAPAASFVLPGGSRAAAYLHLARAVARRAEREVAALLAAEGERCNDRCLAYLNRLSDLCFVWARLANDEGRDDILWQPGASDSRGRF